MVCQVMFYDKAAKICRTFQFEKMPQVNEIVEIESRNLIGLEDQTLIGKKYQILSVSPDNCSEYGLLCFRVQQI